MGIHPDFSDTLYRMADSIITFDEINENDSIAMQVFHTDFGNRFQTFFKSKGYTDIWEYLENRYDMVDSIEENTDDELLEILE